MPPELWSKTKIYFVLEMEPSIENDGEKLGGLGN